MISSVGKAKLAGQSAFLATTIIVLALSTQVNQFTEFFYVADLFPLALSIISLVVVVYLFGMDLALSNAYISRAQSQIAVYGILSIFWLSFNSFSTSRWRHIPFQCDQIPRDFSDERRWCKNLQALKSFVWIEFIISFLICLFTLRYSISQHTRGHKHIFSVSFVRYRAKMGPHPGHASAASFGFSRSDDFLQFEKITEGDTRMGKY
ncbi:hypothetical protein BJ165DRAFT_1390449 [Panaeolus papilionaceus]|nr:hypothetical protein BJ165DRAFT_1390449 [Panaeolus papilionaceus]